MKLLAYLATLVVLAVFFAIVWPLLKALPGVFDLSYLWGLPEDLGLSGGVAPLIHATVVVLGVSVMGALALGLPVAVSMARQETLWLRTLLDLLAGTPSIVFGLLGHALFVQALGMGYSLLAGGLTLTCMVLPFFVRAVEDALRQIPSEYQSLAASLGFSEATRTLRIELPMIRPAILTGLVLSWMRAAAETAALLFTAGYSLREIEGIGLLNSGRPLSVHVFELSMNIAGADDMALRAASLLMLLSLGFVLILRLLPRVGAVMVRAKGFVVAPKQRILTPNEEALP